MRSGDAEGRPNAALAAKTAAAERTEQNARGKYVVQAKCISRESNPGHIDGNDVFYH